jgi:hypothetical protein
MCLVSAQVVPWACSEEDSLVPYGWSLNDKMLGYAGDSCSREWTVIRDGKVTQTFELDERDRDCDTVSLFVHDPPAANHVTIIIDSHYDKFFLVTRDGGKSWKKRLGSLEQQ